MITKRRLITASLAALVALGLGTATYQTWKGIPAPVAVTTVRLNAPFPAIDFAPFYVAKTKGWLAESLANTNAKPEYVGSFGEIALSIESLATNNIDMILTSEIPPIIGRSAGTDLKIIWLSCTLLSEVIVPTSSSAARFTDLKAKRVATLGGSSSHYWLLKNLAKNDLSRDQVQIVTYSKPDDAMAAFETGNADAVALFPPFPEQALAKRTAKVLPGPPAPIQVVMVSRGAFLKEYPSQADAVVKALDRAKAWIIANPAEAQTIVAKETGIALPVVELAWPKLVWTARFDDAVVADIQDRADFLKAEGKIKNAVDVRKDLIAQLP